MGYSPCRAGIEWCIAFFRNSIGVSKIFFTLDSTTFPILSSLSFDDYDLLSNDQIKKLDAELDVFSSQYFIFSSLIKEMRDFISYAYKTEKSILFDPFRNNHISNTAP